MIDGGLGGVGIALICAVVPVGLGGAGGIGVSHGASEVARPLGIEDLAGLPVSLLFSGNGHIDRHDSHGEAHEQFAESTHAVDTTAWTYPVQWFTSIRVCHIRPKLEEAHTDEEEDI